MSDAVDVLWWVLNNRPDLAYTPGPTIGRFLDSDESLAIAVCANQVGKTTGLGKFANDRCLSYDPSTGGPGVFLYVIADLDNHYATVCEKLWEVCARSELDPATKYVEGKGFYTHGKRLTKYSNGARIEWRGGKGEVMALAGITADLGAAVDEIPKRPHFSEVLRACQRWDAPVRVGFTAIGRPAAYLEERVKGLDGSPPMDAKADGSPMWDLYQCGLSVVECPWMTQEQVDEVIARTDPDEVPQRIHGAWSGPTPGRKFNGMTGDVVVPDAPSAVYTVRVIMDHGEGVGRQHAVVWADGGDAGSYILAEYVNANASLVEDDARGIEAALHSVGLGLLDVDEWIGDVNSAGKSAAGEKVNTLFEDAFAKMLGSPRCPFRIGIPFKGAGSVSFGEKLVNLAMLRGDLKICERCPKTIAAVWAYRGTKGDQATHAVDTLRYGALRAFRSHSGYHTLFVRR